MRFTAPLVLSQLPSFCALTHGLLESIQDAEVRAAAVVPVTLPGNLWDGVRGQGLGTAVKQIIIIA